MFSLLSDYYDQNGKPPALGCFLGDMYWSGDHYKTSDPAIWQDWMEALTFITTGKRVTFKKGDPDMQFQITSQEGYKSIYEFVKAHYERINKPKSMGVLLDTIKKKKLFDKWENLLNKNEKGQNNV